MSSEPKAVAWCNPADTDKVISEQKLRALMEHNGRPGRAIAAMYTSPLYDEQALSALRTEVEKLSALRKHHRARHKSYKRRFNELSAEVEALRRDAERFRFIERLAGGSPDKFAVVEDAAFASHYGNEHNFGMNIDAAMEQSA